VNDYDERADANNEAPYGQDEPACYRACKNCDAFKVCRNGQCAECTQLASTYQAGTVDGFNIGAADMLAAIQRITAASASLLTDVDAMRLPEPNTAPAGPYWFGPFEDWSEEEGDYDLGHHQVGIKWPNLAITCTKLRREVEAAKRGRPSDAKDLADRIREFLVRSNTDEYTNTEEIWQLLEDAADFLWKEVPA